MHKANSIVMHAPKGTIFETAANLELWPQILPHYRYIRFLERGADRNVVVMAARRSGIPISWTSEQIIDREKASSRSHEHCNIATVENVSMSQPQLAPLSAWNAGIHTVSACQ
jgi:hypothetical protein